MWVSFMEEALRDRPEHRLPEPPGVVRMWVNRESGRPTMAGSGGAIFEAFLEGYLPQASSALEELDEVGAESVDPAGSEDSLF
jgi:penicillin-binding protein 1A